MSEPSWDTKAEDAPVLLWFREDLRLADNPALAEAVSRNRPIIAIYVLDDETADFRPPGAAARWWLHGSLKALAASLAERGSPLHLFRGSALAVIPRLVRQTGAAAIFWNRRYGAAERAADGKLKQELKASGVEVQSFNGHLLFEPWEVESKTGGPLKVFTPFWRAARELREVPMPVAAPASLRPFAGEDKQLPGSVTLEDLDLLPKSPNWAKEMETLWQPGEAGAAAALKRFLDDAVEGYGDGRNRPDKRSTSRLSPHLRAGEIGPRQIWHATRLHEQAHCGHSSRDHEKFLSEVGWREFSYHLLFQSPDLATANFQKRFDAFPWRDDGEAFRAWTRGKTGYPIVDAGMRELWRTGWMHNRVRMVTASFLIKHLLIDWRRGEEWFWDTLLDADPANNAASWQWVAGSGADAAPYFRIFAPVLQGEKFDPKGDYVRTYVPEIAGLPDQWIHKPWQAPHPILARAGITLGKEYPLPIVDHDAARQRALAAFKSISTEAAS
ncbi:MAG: deoxyribodipyrimidine photo-lyase [Methylocystis sp.]|nr:deoxyribodipyrimidine photo-lyase [Methylocystis sp.]MCA3582500.1 deoxyribodipyrimidine photo-lyase [Methylocystis sp.]MCA3588784.1 deoxyribodipyrimidine photo-lyase [Methylocystis sp.]MCA3592858.1 deoxyribodipyrimidine photo-lyase [Methylocystis sp.]